MGDDINDINSSFNELYGERIGMSVSLSSDGTVLSVSARNYYNDINSVPGLVRVYKWNGSSWVQRGADIIGDNSEGIGISVSLSSDGNILVMGADASNGSDDKTHVKIYFWNGTSWVLQADSSRSGNERGVSKW